MIRLTPKLGSLCIQLSSIPIATSRVYTVLLSLTTAILVLLGYSDVDA